MKVFIIQVHVQSHIITGTSIYMYVLLTWVSFPIDDEERSIQIQVPAHISHTSIPTEPVHVQYKYNEHVQ